MKKLITVLAVAVATTVFADLRIGTVDMMSLVKNHPSYETNKNLLQSMEQDYKKRLDEMREELEKVQSEGKRLADEYRNPMLAQTAKTKLEADLTKIQNDFMEKQQAMRTAALDNQDKLSELESKLLKIQAEDIKTWIAGFARDGGYDLVIDAAAVPYAKQDIDVTEAVVKYMLEHPKSKEKNEGK